MIARIAGSVWDVDLTLREQQAAEGYHCVVWQSEQLTLENVGLALLGPELLAGTAHAFGKAKSVARAVTPGSHS